MSEYNLPVDIGNRALQRVGSELMDASLGFSEISKRAQQVSACYGKLRRAELQGNVWVFATRKAAIRPLDRNTLLLAPTLWSSAVTYFFGSIVSDALGTLWVSRIRSNTNNQPGQVFTAWEPYFGPMAVALYDGTQSYFSGEVVYTAAGNGTSNIFQSQVNGNAVHPALPNQWSTQTSYLKNNVVQRFPAWAIGTTYAAGQGALYTDGNVYVSLTNGNVGNIPPAVAASWALMPILTLGSLIVPVSSQTQVNPPTSSPISEWQESAAYAQGNFVIFNATVYLSLLANNTGNFPNAAASAFWIAVSNGALYQSLIDVNLGNDPLNAPALWSGATTYALNALVGGSDGLIYKSLQNGNTNQQPANGASPTWWQSTGTLLPWTTVFVGGGGNSQWTQIGGAAFPNGVGLDGLLINWPLGSGPRSDSTTSNVYRLPAGHLRRAPQDVSAGRISYLGFPSNDPLTDWEFTGDYIVSSETDVIVYRFVTDFQNVQDMSDMFCEALARRVALEICEAMTQSTAKLSAIREEYKYFVDKAKVSNAIESDAQEDPLDDLIACRW